MKRMSILQTVSVFLLLLSNASITEAQKVAYLFATWTDEGQGLKLAHSPDGYRFSMLNQNRPFLVPKVGSSLLRDPSICRSPDGVFHMVWTTGWWDKVIGHASSRDLITWSAQQAVPVMVNEPGARNCWAPEIFYDDNTGKFIIVWATTITGKFPETAGSSEDDLNHRLYFTCTTDFVKYDSTKLFYNGGFNCIDGFIAKSSTQYILFMKDETLYPTAAKRFRMATASNAVGPYGAASALFPNSDMWYEGPAAMKFDDGSWVVYYDDYQGGSYGALRSTNLAAWTDISSQVTFPEGARHGTVFVADGFILDASVTQGFRWAVTGAIDGSRPAARARAESPGIGASAKIFTISGRAVSRAADWRMTGRFGRAVGRAQK